MADCAWLEGDNCWRTVGAQLAACGVGLGSFDASLTVCDASGGTVTLQGDHTSLRDWYEEPGPAVIAREGSTCATFDIDLDAPAWMVTVDEGTFAQYPLDLDVIYACPDGTRYAAGADLDTCPELVAEGPGLEVAWWSDSGGEGLVATTNPSVELFACAD